MKKAMIFGILLILLAAFLVFFIYRDEKSKELVFYGNIDTRTVNLGFRFLGKIERIYKDEGQSVAKDELLAQLDSKNLRHKIDQITAQLSSEKLKLSKLKGGFRAEEIEQARGAFLQSEANFKMAEDTFKRQENLKAKNATSQEIFEAAKYKFLAAQGQMEQAKAAYEMKKNGYEADDIKSQSALVSSLEASLGAARQDLEDSALKSPVDGVILARLKEEGSIVNAGERVFEISKQDEFWVKAYIDEPYLGAISQGDEMLIFTDVSDKPYEGVIGYISPSSEFTPKNIETIELRSSLVYQFRVIIKNPDKKIKQGMPVTVKPKNDKSR